MQIMIFYCILKENLKEFANCYAEDLERVVDRLPLMTYGLKLSLEA